MFKIFIDGANGTTGIEIKTRLRARENLHLLEIEDHLRKSPAARQEVMSKADIVVFCLPDQAAKESLGLVGTQTKILDASTAHRTSPEWVYGFPELKPDFRDRIKKADRIANPGCYATGFIALVRPLVEASILSPASPLTCNAVSGYSGGGKEMIQAYEQCEEAAEQISKNRRSEHLFHFAPYALSLSHKHLPEMRQFTHLSSDPLFLPAVDHFYRGMGVFVPLRREFLAPGTSLKRVRECLSDYYQGEPFITIGHWQEKNLRADTFLNIQIKEASNKLDITLIGDADSKEGHIVLACRLDNLGKGAAGAAMQNINLMLGLDETEGFL